MSNLAMAGIAEMQTWAASIMTSRPPDLVIGDDPERPYMRRWYVIPRNPWRNVYLHEILRSDDDRAGHDHPWSNETLVIDGEYREAIYNDVYRWQVMCIKMRKAGDTVIRDAESTHRLIVPDGGRAVTLFTTGPRVREWGFWCPRIAETEPRWVHWRDFTSGEKGEKIGRGCGE